LAKITIPSKHTINIFSHHGRRHTEGDLEQGLQDDSSHARELPQRSAIRRTKTNNDEKQKLTHNPTAGQLGRVAVIGGSEEYSGAPYFSAMASAKLGCDMVMNPPSRPHQPQKRTDS